MNELKINDVKMFNKIMNALKPTSHHNLPVSGAWLVNDSWVKNEYAWINNIHLVREIYSDGTPVSDNLGEGWVVCFGCAEDEI